MYYKITTVTRISDLQQCCHYWIFVLFFSLVILWHQFKNYENLCFFIHCYLETLQHLWSYRVQGLWVCTRRLCVSIVVLSMFHLLSSLILNLWYIGLGLFPSGLPTKTLYAFLYCPIRATCPVHLSRLDLRLLIMLGKEYNACSSALGNFLHYSVISSLLAPNSFLSTLFSNILNLCSSLNVRDQVWQPYNTTGNIIVLYVSYFNFLERRRQDKIFSRE